MSNHWIRQPYIPPRDVRALSDDVTRVLNETEYVRSRINDLSGSIERTQRTIEKTLETVKKAINNINARLVVLETHTYKNTEKGIENFDDVNEVPDVLEIKPNVYW